MIRCPVCVALFPPAGESRGGVGPHKHECNSGTASNMQQCLSFWKTQSRRSWSRRNEGNNRQSRCRCLIFWKRESRWAGWVPHERVQQRTVDEPVQQRSVDVPVPQVSDGTVEMGRVVSHERVQQRTVDNVLMSQTLKERTQLTFLNESRRSQRKRLRW